MESQPPASRGGMESILRSKLTRLSMSGQRSCEVSWKLNKFEYAGVCRVRAETGWMGLCMVGEGLEDSGQDWWVSLVNKFGQVQTKRQTHTTENITFLQLRWRALIRHKVRYIENNKKTDCKNTIVHVC